MMSVTPIDFDLSTEVRADHLVAHVRAVELTQGITSRIVSELRARLIDERLVKLLLEFELAHALSEAAMFEVMKCFSPMMSSLRVAFVNRDPKHHPSLEFGVRVSREFGEDYQYFTDLKNAETWLVS